MTTKLTLSVNEEIISKAKKYAKANGKSLSQIVENYFEKITETENKGKQASSRLKKLVGIVKLPDDFNEKQAISEYLEGKYL